MRLMKKMQIPVPKIFYISSSEPKFDKLNFGKNYDRIRF